MHRRHFLAQLSILSTGACLPAAAAGFPLKEESDFARRLRPVGRLLEMEGYYVWCNSPIEGEDGKIHLFFSRWPAGKGMGGWIRGCEICRAVSRYPEGPYEFKEVVLAPREGFFDATTCHNPSIKKVDGRYALFYMGNSNRKTNTKRIGLATAPSPEGPWSRPDAPLLEAGPEGAWDDHCTTNPAFVKHPDGTYWLYYKSWNTKDYETDAGPVRGNRKYGLATAQNLEGPYTKYAGNPLIDFSSRGHNAQLEDAFVWHDRNGFHLLARDMGYYNHEDGIILASKNGINWGRPQTAFYGASHYGIQPPPPPPYLKKYGRFERPQILFLNNKPAYLFTATQGGRYMTASSFLFRMV